MRAVPLGYDDKSGDGLDVALGARRRSVIAEAEEYEAILSYLDEETDSDADLGFTAAMSARGHRAIGYGGPGTPKIPEFRVAEVSSALSMAPNAASMLVADVLDLAYRLPRLYACLHRGDVDAWRVRKVARATREFSLAEAFEADRRLSADTVGDGTPMLCRVTMARLRQILEQIRIATTPDEVDQQRSDNRDDRHVDIWPLDTGVAAISGTLSTADAQRLDARVEQIVSWFRALGDERAKRRLRSVALGWLSDPDSLGMLHDQVLRARTSDEDQTDSFATDDADDHGDASGSDDYAATEGADVDEADRDEADRDVDGPAGGQPEPAGTGASDAERTGDTGSETDAAVDVTDDTDTTDDPIDTDQGPRIPDAFNRYAGRRRELPSTILYLHCDRTWDTWWLDGVGAITKADAIELLGHSRVTIKPVIDLEATITSTGYVASPRLKEQVALMNARYCTFPSCTRAAVNADFDHIRDYHAGGATDSRNGHRLCRFHHRAKTFDDWTVTSPAPGVWLWTSPAGRSYVVTGGTTTRIPERRGRSRARRRKRNAA